MPAEGTFVRIPEGVDREQFFADVCWAVARLAPDADLAAALYPDVEWIGLRWIRSPLRKEPARATAERLARTKQFELFHAERERVGPCQFLYDHWVTGERVRSLAVGEEEEGGAVEREASGTPEPWETAAGLDAPGPGFQPDAAVDAVGRHHQLGALLRALPDERARLRSIGRLPPEVERRRIRLRAAAIIAWLVSFTFVAVFFVLRRPPGEGNVWIPLVVFLVLFVLGRIGKPRRPYVSPPVRSLSSGPRH